MINSSITTAMVSRFLLEILEILPGIKMSIGGMFLGNQGWEDFMFCFMGFILLQNGKINVTLKILHINVFLI